jgi:ABC-type branched-subunit amino acid transport system substrate-binding protein
MKLVKRFLIFLLIPFSLISFTGCKNSSDWNAIQQGKELKIAILVPSADYEEKSSFMAGIKLATEDVKGKGYKVSYKTFSDDDSYEKGVALAREIIKNDEYQMAFSFQNMDTFDTVAKIFEEANKPLFSIEGADDATMNRSNRYVFNLQTTAENFGKAAGKFAVGKGYKKIAVAHSENSFEYNFIEGFNDAVDEDNTVKVVDITAGPYKEQDFEGIFSRWSALGTDAVVLSFADLNWAMKLMSLIKSKNPNMAIIADPYFNNKSYYKGYEKYVEGMVMPSNYPTSTSIKLKTFYEEHKTSLKVPSVPLAAQGFDLVNMIVLKMQNNSTVLEFVNSMKANEGYEGIASLKFNAKGNLESEPNLLVVRNSELEEIEIK